MMSRSKSTFLSRLSGSRSLLACAPLLLLLLLLTAPVAVAQEPTPTTPQSRQPAAATPASPTATPAAAAAGATAPAAATVNPDLSITANVTARELLFEVVPNPKVEFPGQPRRDTVWEAERTNLPPQVQPGVTYRDIGIRLKITSVFADIERIVAEALGETPLSLDPAPTPGADASRSVAAPQQQQQGESGNAPTATNDAAQATHDATQAAAAVPPATNSTNSSRASTARTTTPARSGGGSGGSSSRNRVSPRQRKP